MATAANVRHVILELLAKNLVYRRVLLYRALLMPFATFAAVVNNRLPCVGRLRVRCAHASGNTHQLAATTAFMAHLVNQGVAHNLLALELLLLDRLTDVVVGFAWECGTGTPHSMPPPMN